MASNRFPSIVVPAVAALLLASCAKSREASATGGPSADGTCVYCHGTVGRVGNLSGTDPLLASAPPAAPAGAPASVVGAHQTHLNPPILNPLRGPLACSECHVVPTNLAHATNPPANPVVFGPLARAQGAAPTFDPTTLGCNAVYCHGNFDYAGVKGKAASFTWGGPTVGCGDCHALPPTGHPPLGANVTRATCSQCHPSTVLPDGTINVNGGAHINGRADVAFDCTTCHGTAGRTGFLPGTDPELAAAPPVAPAGAPSYAVGAHQPHLNPTAAAAIRGPLPCNECHVVPTTPEHATNPPAQAVVFGALARTQNANPTWTSTTTGCAATYCHGTFTFNGVAGANATPLWTGAAVTCTSCHGMPPTGHPTLTGTVTAATCSACHPAAVNPDGTINLATGAHLNGQADVVLDCTSCHGTAGRTGTLPGTDAQLASAPPAAPAGAPAYAVGAHQSHLNPPATGYFRGPIACNECHVVPADSAHATNPPAQTVVFGTLARTQNASPTWTSTTTGCAATYCHGNFVFGSVAGANATPLWTGSTLACTSCHGMPPTGHSAVASTPSTCNQCHPGAVNPDGTINLATGAHLNGRADVTFNCTACHGTAGRTGNLPGTDPQLASAPPLAPGGSPASVVGAHLSHVNPPTTGGFRGPLLCNDCHVVPTDAAHATNPPASPVVFGTLAKTQGKNPTWNATTQGCAATYCHGGFSFNGVTGANATPLWSDTGLGCVSCHGLPPIGHPALAGAVTPATCNKCHPSAVNADGTINVATGAHVNGQADVAANCTACHGTAGRPVTQTNPLLDSAPPVAPPGAAASVVGTHLLHLQDSAIRAGVACNNCHVVPSNPDHSIQFPPVIVFSPNTLATTQGAAPTYNATALSCSATYCHGTFAFGAVAGNTTATAAWNSAQTTPGSAASCLVCHGMPPTGHPALSGSITAATCNQCHPDTVNADGTINVAGGRHMNGQSDVTGNPHTGDPAWVDRTHHGYAASSQGMPACTSCHVNFGGPSGGTTGSCNACHTALGFATWQTNCTFCHGTPGRAGNVSGTDALLAAAPPVGPQGQSATTDAMVGAHQKHVNPPSTGRMSVPFACSACHGTPLPTNVDHVKGQPPVVRFSGVAITGNITSATFNPTTLGCSATYCHGNFTGGTTSAIPTWTGGVMACTSCHGSPPSTGQHGRSQHVSPGCGACHSGYSATAANPALHVNGLKDVGGSGTSINSWNASTRQCAPACHGSETW
jgi:predicted CxxxxCH...CXXCH cytochrome family protein